MMSAIPFTKFFNIKMIVREAFWEDEKQESRVYKYFTLGQTDTFTREELEVLAKVLHQPTKEMFKELGYRVEIEKI